MGPIYPQLLVAPLLVVLMLHSSFAERFAREAPLLKSLPADDFDVRDVVPAVVYAGIEEVEA